MSSLPNAPLLLDTASVLLPDREETLFLKASLGVDTQRSWGDWRACKPDLNMAIASSPACKRLLPLLFFTLKRSGIAVAQGELALLRVAASWERQRAERVGSLLVDILATLKESSIEPVVLKGVALAHLAYPEPWLRHCHDLDLLIPEHQHSRAVEAISRLGFSRKKSETSNQAKLVLVHTDGLPVSIHAGLYPDFSTFSCIGSSPGAIRAKIGGVLALVLAPEEILLFMAAQLLAGRIRDRTSWVVDTVFLLRATKADDIDWTALADEARDRGLALVLLAMLTYLDAEFDAQIPELALLSLCRKARLGPEARDRLLFLLRKNPGIGSSTMLGVSGWRSRIDVMRWMAVPTRTYMQGWCREKGLRWSLVWYVLRPLRRLFKKTLVVAGRMRKAPVNKGLL